MMGSAVTPENKVKKQVKLLLDQYRSLGLYSFWPVPSGFGASSVDCLVCFGGKFIAIETKAPGKKPTERQQFTLNQVRAAGGATFVVSGEFSLGELRSLLESIKDEAKGR